MISVDDIRKKLFTQRRNLFRQVAQAEDELLWLETDVESEVEERGQEESMVRLLDRLAGCGKTRLLRHTVASLTQALSRQNSPHPARWASEGRNRGDRPGSRQAGGRAVWQM